MSLLFVERAGQKHDAAVKPHHDWTANPVRIYLILLSAILVLDALEVWLTPKIFPALSTFSSIYFDPIFTTLFIAPVLWWVLIRPLQQSANDKSVRYEAVRSQVVDAVVTIDMDGVIISFNPAAERIFGYSPAEISGKNAATLFCDDSLSAVNLEAFANANNGSAARIHEVTCHRKDGHPLRLEISVSRLLLAGTPQFLVIMRDITKRLEMEQASRELQARLIQANKMTALGLMVSGVAHEINNPNNYILSNAQLMERSCADMIKIMREYQQEYGEFYIGGLPFSEMERHFPEMISGIIDGTQRINCIVNDLKVFARQGPDVFFEETDLNLAVKAALLIVSSQVSRHTRNFSVHLDPNLPKIVANSQQIGQVVINLIMNACQSLADESAAVCLETFPDWSAAEVVIRVIDEGSGIPEECAEKIWDPFFSTRLRSGGTGLGLSISNTIIKEHSGRLTFHSEPGRGTTFEVRLPMVKQAEAEAQ